MTRTDGITALVTCQMGASYSVRALFGPRKAVYDVHLVRYRGAVPGYSGGTPGPTLCDIDRFGDDAPGWTLGGGVDGPGVVQMRCTECTEVAFSDFPGLPIDGRPAQAELFREALAAYASKTEE